MEYVMYILIIMVCGMVLHDRLTTRNKEVNAKPTPIAYETQVIQFPDEDINLPEGMKVHEVPDISEWTPPMKEIFHLITKDRKSWIKTEVDGNIRYIHKEFCYYICTKLNIYGFDIRTVAGVKVLDTSGVLNWFEERDVIDFAEIYFKVKYHKEFARIERIVRCRSKRYQAELEQQRLLIKQQEADKINEYLATLKKG